MAATGCNSTPGTQRRRTSINGRSAAAIIGTTSRTSGYAPSTAIEPPGRCRQVRFAPFQTRTICLLSSRSWTKWHMRSAAIPLNFDWPCSTAKVPAAEFRTPAMHQAPRLITTWTGCGSPYPGRLTVRGRPTSSTTVGGALRLANCLRVAAGKAGWGKTLPPNTGLGVAVSSAEERQSPTWVAGVAEVTVDTKTGRYKINRITVAMDPGTVINPRNATAQIQGATLWGASQVMAERLTLKDGGIEQSNFHEYTPIRLADVPPIDVELIELGPPPKWRWRALFDDRGAGCRQCDLQCRRGSRAPHADYTRGGSGRVEKKSLTIALQDTGLEGEA